jgi:hypothetical protein
MGPQNTQPKGLASRSCCQPSLHPLLLVNAFANNMLGTSMPSTTVAPAPPKIPSRTEKSFSFRCFFYHQKSTGMFVAECIDLDLMVKARKPNKAMRELRDAVYGYVQVALESDLDGALIPRPSPLSHRLHYHVVRLASRLSLLREDRLFDCTPPAAHTRCYA